MAGYMVASSWAWDRWVEPRLLRRMLVRQVRLDVQSGLERTSALRRAARVRVKYDRLRQQNGLRVYK